MKIWTWGEMKQKVQEDLNIEDEGFITDRELLGYANQAIDEAEQEFMSIYDKYFETEIALELVEGQSVYDLPGDIYATKITLVQYNDGSRRYPIKRIRKLEEIAHITETEDYKYRIFNTTGVGSKIHLYPASRENSTGNVSIYYLRNASEVVDDDSIIDLPEAAQFIIQHIKDSCANKELGSMYSAPPSPALEKQRQLMLNALSDMVPDEDNKIEPDLSFYEDFDTEIYHGGY